ncbi:MAG: MarR family transcriptional regulator [Dehalococcoidales bacterium]|nr:MarR family transcriptional regulator [Dehalococcoidales bacterium]
MERDQLVAEITELGEPIYEHFMAAHADAWRHVNLTMQQFKVLASVVTNSRVDGRYLQRQLNVLPSTLTRIVDKLVAKDLVTRRNDTADRRVVFLEPTEEGVRLIRSLTVGAMPEMMGQAAGRLSAEQLVALRDGLAVLSEAIAQAQKEEEPVASGVK